VKLENRGDKYSFRFKLERKTQE